MAISHVHRRNCFKKGSVHGIQVCLPIVYAQENHSMAILNLDRQVGSCTHFIRGLHVVRALGVKSAFELSLAFCEVYVWPTSPYFFAGTFMLMCIVFG